MRGPTTLRLVALAMLLGACAPETVRPRSVLLITLDTTRADALGCYGGPEGVSPRLDALARESVLYAQARTTAPITLPAHASMMTGLYPPRHAVRDNSLSPLPEAAVTLAERARDRGIETAAFLAAVALDAELGLDQGFELYDGVPRQRRRVSVQVRERPADEVLSRASAWLRERETGRPFLAWVHFFDPHFPYEPPRRFLDQAGGDAYGGEVAHVDHAVGELLDVAAERGLLDETLVIVVGDHGEGLGDHGESTHATLCYDSTLRVPFLVRHPDGWRAGEVSEEIVSVADVFPTVIEALDLGPPGDVDGLSLWRGRAPADRGVYFESYYPFLQFGWSPIVGWADRGGKYLRSGDEELFDTAADPSEENDLADEGPLPGGYGDAIARVAERPVLRSEAPVDDELLEQLRSLGYATGGSAAPVLPGPLEDTGLPSPRLRMEERARVYGAFAEAERGDVDVAIRMLRAVVGENPRNVSARSRLSVYLLQRERFAEAEQELREILAMGFHTATNHNNLGYALMSQGRDEEALAHVRRAYALDAGDPYVHAVMARLLRRMGRDAEAERFERMEDGSGPVP